MRAIFHIDEKEKWPLALGNAKNMLSYCESAGEKCELELLANSVAVDCLREKAAKELGILSDLVFLSERGTVISACNNAMRSLHIEREELAPFVTVVPAGVVELARRQHSGYAYIKP